MSEGNDYWPAKVETMRKIEADLRAEYQTLWDAFTEAQAQRDMERAELRRQAETIERLRGVLQKIKGTAATEEVVKLAGDALRGANETAGEHPLDEWLVPTKPEETAALTRAALTPCTGCNSTPCVCEKLGHEP